MSYAVNRRLPIRLALAQQTLIRQSKPTKFFLGTSTFAFSFDAWFLSRGPMLFSYRDKNFQIHFQELAKLQKYQLLQRFSLVRCQAGITHYLCSRILIIQPKLTKFLLGNSIGCSMSSFFGFLRIAHSTILNEI